MKTQMSRRGVLVGAAAMACAGQAALAATEDDGSAPAPGKGQAAEGGPVGPSKGSRVAGVGPHAQAPRSGAAGDDGNSAKGDAAKQLAALEKREGGRLGV